VRPGAGVDQRSAFVESPNVPCQVVVSGTRDAQRAVTWEERRTSHLQTLGHSAGLTLDLPRYPAVRPRHAWRSGDPGAFDRDARSVTDRPGVRARWDYAPLHPVDFELAPVIFARPYCPRVLSV